MAENIVKNIWNSRNTVCEDSLLYGDYPSASVRSGSKQLTYLLYLKIVDECTMSPYKHNCPVPAKYSWPSLTKKIGDEQFDQYGHILGVLGDLKG